MEIEASHLQLAIVESSQPPAASFTARKEAEQSGFGEEDAHRAGLVAMELATNLLKHAVGGELLVRRVAAAPHPELELLAIDRGPGMDDVAQCLSDGHSTTGTPGNGLGAVRRLADDFDIYSQKGRGTVVLARLRARRAPKARQSRLDIAGISVAMDGEVVCGDSWRAYQHADGAMIVVADGLGHGVYASEASAAAVGAFSPRKEADLALFLQAMHESTRHTRGAAAAIAEIHLQAGVLKYAGIGNISGAISTPGAMRHVVSLNGTLGHEARRFREYSYPWEADATFVMFSDGLGSHWSLDDYPGVRLRDPAILAALLYRDYSRKRDDVTVLVARKTA